MPKRLPLGTNPNQSVRSPLAVTVEAPTFVYLFQWRAFERSRTAADASRDIIWQGNCNSTDQYSICKVTDQTADSTFALLRSTIAIEYPISNCPAKSGAASFKRLP